MQYMRDLFGCDIAVVLLSESIFPDEVLSLYSVLDGHHVSFYAGRVYIC